MSDSEVQVRPYVFISYSTIDAEVAGPIATLLDGMGIEHFLDKKEIRWGDRFEGTIARRIADCSHLVVIVSPASVQSLWVPYEVGQAQALGKTLLPYLTHPSINLPSFLANLHYVTEMEAVRAFFQGLAGIAQSAEPNYSASPASVGTRPSVDLKRVPSSVRTYVNQEAADLPKFIKAARSAIDILAITLESRPELIAQLTKALSDNGELRHELSALMHCRNPEGLGSFVSKSTP